LEAIAQIPSLDEDVRRTVRVKRRNAAEMRALKNYLEAFERLLPAEERL
jgi:hypothetical protein